MLCIEEKNLGQYFPPMCLAKIHNLYLLFYCWEIDMFSYHCGKNAKCSALVENLTVSDKISHACSNQSSRKFILKAFLEKNKISRINPF